MTNEPTNGTPRACNVCGKDIRPGEPKRLLKQMGPSGEKREDDPIIGAVHELCAMRQDLLMAQQERAMMGQLLIAVVKQFGGSLKVSQRDMAKAAETPDIDINQTPDGFITLDVKRVIVLS